MVRFKAGLVIGLAALAATSSTPLLAQAFNGNQVVSAVGIADLQQFVQQHGDTVVQTGQAGNVSVLAKAPSGLNYSLVGAACNQQGVTGCEGIFMQVKYTTTPAVTDATLSASNTRFAALKIWQDQGKTIVGVSRYVILRGGVTKQNIINNIDVLVGVSSAAAGIAFGQAPAPAAPPAGGGN